MQNHKSEFIKKNSETYLIKRILIKNSLQIKEAKKNNLSINCHKFIKNISIILIPISYAVFYFTKFFEFTWRTSLTIIYIIYRGKTLVYVSFWAPEVSHKTAILVDVWKNSGISPSVILSQINISKSNKKGTWCFNFIGIIHIINSFTALVHFLACCKFPKIICFKKFPKFNFFQNSKIYIQGVQFQQFSWKAC